MAYHPRSDACRLQSLEVAATGARVLLLKRPRRYAEAHRVFEHLWEKRDDSNFHWSYS